MLTSDFNYYLPQELIAQCPLRNRDESRLLVYDRKDDSICDTVFSSVIDYLNPGDVLVRNTTKVIPARLYGKRLETGGIVEFLLLECIGEHKWKCLTKPYRRVKHDVKYVISDELSVIALSDSDIEG